MNPPCRFWSAGLVLVVALLLAPAVGAQEGERAGSTPDGKTLERQLEEMRKEMERMRRDREEESRALRERIADLESRLSGTEPMDSAANRRALKGVGEYFGQ